MRCLGDTAWGLNVRAVICHIHSDIGDKMPISNGKFCPWFCLHALQFLLFFKKKLHYL